MAQISKKVTITREAGTSEVQMARLENNQVWTLSPDGGLTVEVAGTSGWTPVKAASVSWEYAQVNGQWIQVGAVPITVKATVPAFVPEREIVRIR